MRKVLLQQLAVCYKFPPLLWSRRTFLPRRKVSVILQRGFPAEQAICTEQSCDTACDVRPVYLYYSFFSTLPCGCTTLIKRSLVHHAYEQRFKERQLS